MVTADAEVVAAYREHWDAAASEETALGQYAGEWDSLAQWGEDVAEDMGVLDGAHPSLRHYVDWASWARDVELEGGIWTHISESGTILVFWSS